MDALPRVSVNEEFYATESCPNYGALEIERKTLSGRLPQIGSSKQFTVTEHRKCVKERITFIFWLIRARRRYSSPEEQIRRVEMRRIVEMC